MKQTLSVILPINEYLELIPGTPFPRANDKVSSAMSTAGFTNVMDYGAKGMGGLLMIMLSKKHSQPLKQAYYFQQDIYFLLARC
jgi:hypothetical protein